MRLLILPLLTVLFLVSGCQQRNNVGKAKVKPGHEADHAKEEKTPAAPANARKSMEDLGRLDEKARRKAIVENDYESQLAKADIKLFQTVVVPVMIDALKTGDVQTRTNVAQQLHRIIYLGRSDVGRRTDQVFNMYDEGKGGYEMLVQTLATDEQLLSALVNALTDPEELVRAKAAGSLMTLGPLAKSSVPDIGKLLKKETGTKRIVIAEVLWSIDRDSEALVALVAEMRAGDSIGRKAATHALWLLSTVRYDEHRDNRGDYRIYPVQLDQNDFVHLRPTEADLSKIANTKGAVSLLLEMSVAESKEASRDEAGVIIMRITSAATLDVFEGAVKDSSLTAKAKQKVVQILAAFVGHCTFRENLSLCRSLNDCSLRESLRYPVCRFAKTLT